MSDPVNNEKQEKQFIRIVYEDSRGNVQNAVIPIDEDDYSKETSYRERIEMVVQEIYDLGGFWLNTTTIIPYHRVKSFSTYQQEKPIIHDRNKRRKRRRPVNKNGIKHDDTSCIDNSSSQPKSDSRGNN
jgi:uncharacterized protein (UPF0248 family)